MHLKDYKIHQSCLHYCGFTITSQQVIDLQLRKDYFIINILYEDFYQDWMSTREFN